MSLVSHETATVRALRGRNNSDSCRCGKRQCMSPTRYLWLQKRVVDHPISHALSPSRPIFNENDYPERYLWLLYFRVGQVQTRGGSMKTSPEVTGGCILEKNSVPLSYRWPFQTWIFGPPEASAICKSITHFACEIFKALYFFLHTLSIGEIKF